MEPDINKKDSKDIEKDIKEIMEQNTNNVKKTSTIIKNKSKFRMILVILFIALFLIVSFIGVRANYLEFKELGENFEEVFFTNFKYRALITGTCFVILYIVMYLTNRGIKKGLKVFFDKEKITMPKLPNKSISLIFSSIASAIVGTTIMEKIILYFGNTSFGITDPIFNFDIGYYMFQKPLIETILLYVVILIVLLTIYSIIYYILTFNFCFDGIERDMLKKSSIVKKIIRNIRLIAIGISLLTIFGTQNILFDKIMTVNGNIDVTGAGYTASTVKLFGYVILAIVIVVATFIGTINFQKGKNKKVIKSIITIPAYLVILFIITASFDGIFVNSNKLDKEKDYLQYNIDSTKQAYNINIEEKKLENSGTITEEEIKNNQQTVNNIPIVSQDVMIKSLKDSQTETGHYTYRNANLAKYKIDGENRLVYISPREVANKAKTYNNKTYEYTHSQGIVVASASTMTENGNVEYIQKDVTGEDQKIKITEPRMYFGLESDDIVVTNVKGKNEYDYTDKNGTEVTSIYNGNAGLNLNGIDKLILGISKGDFKLAFSSDITDESKVLINRNVVDRAKKALPYLVYEENPYTVVDKNGRIIWVIDGYTTSSQYPYSQYTNIEHDNRRERINYIRNSVKVLIDSYSGEISYYITDRTDPIAMAYEKIYPTLFKDKNEKIPEDISEHFVYPQYLYNVQSKILEVYHNVKPDVLYREDDVWQIAKFNTSNVSKATGTTMDSYYTMLKPGYEKDDIGLVQIYSPKDKQNLISYLVGTTNGSENKLKLYKFSQDSNCVGPMQLTKQIEEDESISAQLEALNVSGTKITKQMIIVPIKNTLLYVEPIYQTMLNEESDVPILKKVIVASGNKVAIGNNLSLALQNLLSQNAVDIEIENTDDIDGLIDAIIKANKNLTQSNDTGNWELMGKDIDKLQTLIKSLETLKEAEDKKKQEQADKLKNKETETNTVDTNTNNVLDNADTKNNVSNKTN
ncbi:MAG: UPF0182 family protein [Clostridia bacterium]|nr:UPF0182 family protein [Clostridia bacterium]